MLYLVIECTRTIKSIHSIYSTSGFDSNVQGHESNCNSNNGGCPVTLCIRERSNDALERYPENRGKIFIDNCCNLGKVPYFFLRKLSK